MTDDDKAAFSQALSRLFAGWNRTPTREQLASWWVALRDLPWPAVAHALTLGLRASETAYPPAPAVIRKLAASQPGDTRLPDGARHAAGCPGACGCWATIEQRHPLAGQAPYRETATRTRAVRACRTDLTGADVAQEVA